MGFQPSNEGKLEACATKFPRGFLIRVDNSREVFNITKILKTPSRIKLRCKQKQITFIIVYPL